MPRAKEFCTLEALKAGATLAGTAPQISHYILIEYPGVWPARAVEDAPQFSDAVKEHLAAQLKTLPHPRILFIRKEGQARSKTRQVFFIAASTTQPWVAQRIVSATYAELEELNFKEIFTQAQPVKALDMLLVCTHGTRDGCCGTFGGKTYKALQTKMPDWDVWQCSHVGGHRLAPCVVHPATGRYYGHVFAEKVDDFSSSLQHNAIATSYCRGCSLWPAPAQAAELAVREKVAEIAGEAFEVEQQSELCCRVFHPSSGQAWQVELLCVPEHEEEVLCSCMPPKRQKIFSYKPKNISLCG